MADIFNIAGEINSTSQEGTAVHANQVKDDLQNKKQSQINEEVGEELELHTNRLNALTGQNYVTVVATQSTTAADIPTLINASGEGEQADTIYRVGFWDGSAYVADKYTEYAWKGTAYVILDVKSSIGEVFDISQYNAVGGTLAIYADLAAALGASGENVPAFIRKGGMRIQFIKGTVQSSDNKYVQCRYMSTSTAADFTNVANWQGVDDVITAGGVNIAKSGAVSRALYDSAYKVPITSWRDVPILDEHYYLTPSGGKISHNSWGISNYINVSEGDAFNYKLKGNNSDVALYALYDNNKKFVSSYTGSSSQQTGTVTIPSGIYFIRFCGQFYITTVTDTYDSNNVAIYPKDINTKIGEVENSISSVDAYSKENKREIVALMRESTSYDKTLGSESVVTNTVLKANGSTESNPSYSTSGFINIEKASKIIYKNLYSAASNTYAGICLYNENKDIPCIVGLKGSGSINLNIKTYPNARYIRFCCSPSSTPSVELINETETDELQIKMSKTPVKKYANLVNSAINFQSGLGANYRDTEFIEVEGEETYKFYGVYSVFEYDSNKTLIDTHTNNNAKTPYYTLNSNTKYIRVRWNIADYPSICVQKGLFVGEPVPYGYYYEDEIPDEFVRDTNNIVGDAESKYAIGYQYDNSGNLSYYNLITKAWDFIAVNASTKYKISGSLNALKLLAYDSEKELIGTITFDNLKRTFETDANTSYIKVSFIDNNTKLIICEFTGLEVPVQYDTFKLDPTIKVEPNVIPGPLNGKIWNVMGDSISDDGTGAAGVDKYWAVIRNRAGIKVRCYGIGGTKIGGSSENAMCNRYTEMDDNADYITVFGGTNDFAVAPVTPIGQWGDSTNATLYGAMKILCEGLLTKYIGKKIGFITPLPRYTSNTDYSWPNTGLTEYVECIQDVCKRYSIPCLDLYTGSDLCPKIPSVLAAVMPDGLHPNAVGHALISYKIQKFLESL